MIATKVGHGATCSPQNHGTDHLNFALVGPVRSGMSVISSLINSHAKAVCHVNLFASSVEVRRDAHESYFGPSDKPSWFQRHEQFEYTHSNPWQYIRQEIFDKSLHNERVTGLVIPYDFIAQYELPEMFDHCYREGGFCLIHVIRNPVSCFVSLLEQKAARDNNKHKSYGVRVDALALTNFVRHHAAVRNQITQSCPDAVEVHFRDLLSHTRAVSDRLMAFLELSRLKTSVRVAKRKPVKDRIANYAELVKGVPIDVKCLLKPEELY